MKEEKYINLAKLVNKSIEHEKKKMFSTVDVIIVYLFSTNSKEKASLLWRAIYAYLKGDEPLTYYAAEYINKMIPDLTPRFLINYDYSYQHQKEEN